MTFAQAARGSARALTTIWQRSSRRSALPDGEHRYPEGSADLREHAARVGHLGGMLGPDLRDVAPGSAGAPPRYRRR